MAALDVVVGILVMLAAGAFWYGLGRAVLWWTEVAEPNAEEIFFAGAWALWVILVTMVIAGLVLLCAGGIGHVILGR